MSRGFALVTGEEWGGGDMGQVEGSTDLFPSHLHHLTFSISPLAGVAPSPLAFLSPHQKCVPATRPSAFSLRHPTFVTLFSR